MEEDLTRSEKKRRQERRVESETASCQMSSLKTLLMVCLFGVFLAIQIVLIKTLYSSNFVRDIWGVPNMEVDCVIPENATFNMEKTFDVIYNATLDDNYGDLKVFYGDRCPAHDEEELTFFRIFALNYTEQDQFITSYNGTYLLINETIFPKYDLWELFWVAIAASVLFWMLSFMVISFFVLIRGKDRKGFFGRWKIWLYLALLPGFALFPASYLIGIVLLIALGNPDNWRNTDYFSSRHVDMKNITLAELYYWRKQYEKDSKSPTSKTSTPLSRNVCSYAINLNIERRKDLEKKYGKNLISEKEIEQLVEERPEATVEDFRHVSRAKNPFNVLCPTFTFITTRYEESGSVFYRNLLSVKKNIEANIC